MSDTRGSSWFHIFWFLWAPKHRVSTQMKLKVSSANSPQTSSTSPSPLTAALSKRISSPTAAQSYAICRKKIITINTQHTITAIDLVQLTGCWLATMSHSKSVITPKMTKLLERLVTAHAEQRWSADVPTIARAGNGLADSLRFLATRWRCVLGVVSRFFLIIICTGKYILICI